MANGAALSCMTISRYHCHREPICIFVANGCYLSALINADFNGCFYFRLWQILTTTNCRVRNSTYNQRSSVKFMSIEIHMFITSVIISMINVGKQKKSGKCGLIEFILGFFDMTVALWTTFEMNSHTKTPFLPTADQTIPFFGELRQLWALKKSWRRAKPLSCTHGR